MKRLLVLLSTVLVLATPGLAFAQKGDNDASFGGRRDAANAWMHTCMAAPDVAAQPNPAAECACAAGLMSGHMNDRQYTIFGRLVPFSSDNEAMAAEVQRMVSEGYSGPEILVVGNMMQNLAPDITATCEGIGAPQS